MTKSAEKEPVYLNPHQLAQRWGLTYGTLERWRWRGTGPRFMKIGWRIKYRIEDVIAYEEGHMYSATQKDPGKPV